MADDKNKKAPKVAPKAAPKIAPANKIDTKGQQALVDMAAAYNREQQKSILQSTALTDLATQLASSWSGMSDNLKAVNQFSTKLGSNFSGIEDISKKMVANINNIGSELYEQLDVSKKISDINSEQGKRAAQIKKSIAEEKEFLAKKLKTENEFTDISEKLAEAQKQYAQASEDIIHEAEKAARNHREANTDSFSAAQKIAEESIKSLSTEREKIEAAIELNKEKAALNKLATADVKLEMKTAFFQIQALNAIRDSATALDLANHHAEKLGFNLENATNTVSNKLSKSFGFLEEIPFLSDVLGLDAVKEHIEKNVKDSLVKSMMAGKGAGASMFTGMIAGARTLMASLAPMLPLILAAAAALAVIATIEKAFEFDKELTKFSRDLDVSKDNALGMAIEADKIAGSMGVIGIHGKEILDTTIALREEFGVLGGPGSEKLVKNVTFLREKMGLTNEEALGLNSTATILGTTLEKLTAESMNMAEGLIGSKAMLKEMSKLPKSLVAGFKGTVKELEKAVIKGKLFGLTLEKTRSIGEGMLDIESSLEKEMTANVLTGKHMNLNAARQYALTGQYGKLQDEILVQAKSLDEFTSQGPLQQKAIADAMGMTVDELVGMLSKAEELDKVYGMSADRAEQLMKLADEKGKIDTRNLKDGELAWAIQQNATKDQEEATAKYDSAMKSLGEAFQKVALPIVEILGEALGLIGKLITKVTHVIEGFNEWYHSLTAVVDPITGATEKLKEGEGVMHSILKVALGIGGAMLLWKVGKSAVSGIKGMAEGMKSMMPGASKTPAAPSAPDTSKMDKAKGKGSEGGLTSLAGGLKAMGQSGVGKGILNTALAGPALLLSLPSIPFLAFIGKVKLDKLEANFTGLGNGLKSMDGTLKGSLATGAFGIAGALALASIPFLLVFGKVKLDKLEDNFTKLGAGLKQMSGTLSGSLATGAFGVAGLLAVASIPFLLVFGKAKFNTLQDNFAGLANGLKEMEGTMSGSLALGAFGVAGLLALASVPFLLIFGKIELDKLEDNFAGLGSGLGEMEGTLKGSLATGAFGVAGLLAMASIPFLLVFGKVKLDQLTSNFTSLGTGLKSMSGTMAGSAALAAFGLAATVSLLSIPFLLVFGKVKLNQLATNFTSLSMGLQSMSSTMPGSAALAAFGAAGAISLLSVPFLLVFGKVKFDQLITNFTSLSTGLQSMSGTIMGSAGLGAFALAGALAIPSLIFLGVFGKVTFGSLIPNFTGLAEGLIMMSATLLGSAALAAFGLAAIIALPSLIFLGGIALLGAVASAGLIALGTGLASLGAVAATGLPFIAVGLIAALGLAMIPFGIALAQSAPGIKAFAEVLGAMGPIIIATFEGIGNVIDRISGGIAMIITTIATSIKSLSDINPLTLIGVAGGIIAVGAAIAGFGAGAGAGGIMAGIGKFFDEDPVDKFNRFAKIDSGKLIEVADSIKQTGISIGSFGSLINAGQLDSVGIAIDKLSESLSNFGAGAAAGGMVSGIASFFDEDPVEKFNRFASIDGNKLLQVANSIKSLGETIGSFGTAINIKQLDSVGEAINKIGTSIEEFTSKSSGGSLLSFFEEDPVEKFNRFASIDGNKLLQVANSIKSLGDTIGSFGTAINVSQLESVGIAIDKLSESLSNFGAGGLISSIGSFFEEDPVEKFNRFASIDGNKLLQVANSIKSLGETIGSFGTAINIGQLDSVGEAINRIGTSIADFGAKAASGGMMAGLGSFFDEDPVEKFNKFATIDSGKLLEVASAIDKLGNAFRNFSTSVSNIGDTSGITSTIDKVMELQDSIVSSPMENIVDSVSSAVDSVFAKASEFVSSIMPEDIGTSMTPVQPTSDVQAVQTVAPAPAVIEKQPIVATTTQQAAAPAAQGSLTEVAGLLKQLIAATSQPVKINIGGRVIDEIEKQTTLRKTYNTKVDSGYGTHG